MKEDKIPGYRNYDKWNEGFDKYREYLLDGFKYIRLGEEHSKYHSDDETIEEAREKMAPFLAALLKGAAALQYVGETDFYYNNQDMEILIKFKKDYKDTSIDKLTSTMFKDLILLLEQEEKQLKRIATAIRNDGSNNDSS